MLGYTKEDIEEMINSVHDSKLYIIHHEDIQSGEESSVRNGLLKTISFLQGLLTEGYIDEP